MTEYFVSSSLGNSANPGSMLLPLADSPDVEALALLPGDKVRFLRGDLFSPLTLTGQNGESDNEIELLDYGFSKSKPLFDRTTVKTNWWHQNKLGRLSSFEQPTGAPRSSGFGFNGGSRYVGAPTGTEGVNWWLDASQAEAPLDQQPYGFCMEAYNESGAGTVGNRVGMQKTITLSAGVQASLYVSMKKRLACDHGVTPTNTNLCCVMVKNTGGGAQANYTLQANGTWAAGNNMCLTTDADADDTWVDKHIDFTPPADASGSIQISFMNLAKGHAFFDKGWCDVSSNHGAGNPIFFNATSVLSAGSYNYQLGEHLGILDIPPGETEPKLVESFHDYEWVLTGEPDTIALTNFPTDCCGRRNSAYRYTMYRRDDRDLSNVRLGFTDMVVHLRDCSNVDVSQLEARGGAWQLSASLRNFAMFRCSGANPYQGITFRNCSAHDGTGYGFMGAPTDDWLDMGTDVHFLHNEAYRCEGGVSGRARNGTIRGNWIHDISTYISQTGDQSAVNCDNYTKGETDVDLYKSWPQKIHFNLFERNGSRPSKVTAADITFTNGSPSTIDTAGSVDFRQFFRVPDSAGHKQKLKITSASNKKFASTSVTIDNVTATRITLASGDALTNSGPVTATLEVAHKYKHDYEISIDNCGEMGPYEVIGNISRDTAAGFLQIVDGGDQSVVALNLLQNVGVLANGENPDTANHVAFKFGRQSGSAWFTSGQQPKQVFLLYNTVYGVWDNAATPRAVRFANNDHTNSVMRGNILCEIGMGNATGQTPIYIDLYEMGAGGVTTGMDIDENIYYNAAPLTTPWRKPNTAPSDYATFNALGGWNASSLVGDPVLKNPSIDSVDPDDFLPDTGSPAIGLCSYDLPAPFDCTTFLGQTAGAPFTAGAVWPKGSWAA